MPGYVVHLAACKERNDRKEFIYGIIMPDILKKWYKTSGNDIEKTMKKYNSIKISNMPEFSVFEQRVTQKENSKTTDGMHYGFSSNPNVLCFWKSLSEIEKNQPFYKGYLIHLLTDLLVYKAIDINYKSSEVERIYGGTPELLKQEHKKLLHDWDVTNYMIENIFGKVQLPEVVQELNVVKYEEGTVKYIDSNIVIECLNYFRSFDPLTVNLDAIILDIIDMCKEMDNLPHDENRSISVIKLISEHYENSNKKYIK